MTSHPKTPKNYQRTMKRLEFDFPGLSYLPRAPATYQNLDTVDLYIGRKKLELLHRIPRFDSQFIRQKTSDFGLDKRFTAALLEGGYIDVESELKGLVQEEKELLENSAESGRTQSFLKNKTLVGELIKGLIECNEIDKTNRPSESVRVRKTLGEQLISLEDFWLARKMFTKCFEYLEQIDEETDKMRVELWCLISYVCIYFEECQEIGFDLPMQCLVLTRNICQNKPWSMRKSVMNILLPKAVNIYGLRNDWLKIKSDWANIYNVATILLHVLSVKRALYWQQQLIESVGKRRSVDELKGDPKSLLMYENIGDALTSALAYADQVRQNPAFIATSLRRGLFYEEHGDTEKAMEDFFALYTLCKSFDDKTTLAIVLNRLAQNRLLNKNPVEALDYFVQELELATENDFPELAGDAFQGLGSTLLEEGHTWEADECFSHAYSIFSEHKESDTPNDMDDISWAMLGLSRGQHLWSRYSGLIRTQERHGLKAVNEWKCNRKPLPLVKFSERKCPIKKRATFENRYSRKGEDDQAHLFEIRKELWSKRSIWFETHGCENMFGYMTSLPPTKKGSPILDQEILASWEKEQEAMARLTASRIGKAASMAHSWKNVSEKRSTGGVVQKMNTFLDVAAEVMKNLDQIQIAHDHDHDEDESEDPELASFRRSGKSVRYSEKKD